ncbi:alginate lyase family protein [Pseudonocardia lacus]|uniref:alginate lyase family protein n=1 Tax=Pseudonocardia lacus TaxID=2835865 RepID=UPI001BDC6676|nr:alginate lyase family protein [Pseudonocardia lacus]
MDARWYLRRLSRMGPSEIAGRVLDRVGVRRWRAVAAARVPAVPDALPERRFTSLLPAGALDRVPAAARADLVAAAERLLDGHAEYFGVRRDDMVSPDWHRDPRTGRRAPGGAYAFDIPYRDESTIGDVKQLWEPSRHQHLTVLAAAYALTGDDRYAHRVADHLKSWWAENPPLRGVHWTSGIELGIRLISWAWVRRLLAGWPKAPGVFEDAPEALHQLRRHQEWLRAFPSRGSSANNHAVAEAAGALVAATAFPWFPESARWARDAAARLDRHLRANTFPSGLNRELASEYHGLVLELGLVAAADATAAGVELPTTTWRVLQRMTDALAAVVDTDLRPPRQGDGDDGYGLVLDGAGRHRWASLLTAGEQVFGRLDWWPDGTAPDVAATLVPALVGPRALGERRPVRRPAHFADAGLTVLRVPRDAAGGEVWCRADAGPHGFLSIAAHAHADALSIEVRHDGVDVLADPGTYCYHGEPAWRSYFRSTRGHNTVELDGTDQSQSGGPFLWTRHARSRVLVADTASGQVLRWSGEHDGYSRRGRPVRHRRSVELHRGSRDLVVVDEVRTGGPHACRLALHLGPTVGVELDGNAARLRWTAAGAERRAELTLPDALTWTVHRGETDPPLGWYSPGFGRKEPSSSLVGRGSVGPGTAPLRTVLTGGW